MTRYLVAFDANSGFAELCNVGCVEAESEEEAKRAACRLFRISTDGATEMVVKPLDEIVPGWAYFV